MKILIIDPEYYHMERLIRFLKEKHEVTISAGTKQTQNYHKAYNLNSFDYIFLKIIMPCGIFSLEETHNGLETGWIVYDRFLKDLENTKIVVWTESDYMYPNNEQPKRAWGKNVYLKKKDISDNYFLVKIIEEINLMQGSLII